jgi:hypothetical protein
LLRLANSTTEGNEFVAKVVELDDVTLHFAVAGMNDLNQDGPKASVDIQVFGSNFPTVKDALWTGEGTDASPIVVTWSFPKHPRLRGFRIEQGGMPLADEKVIGADTRRFVYPKQTHSTLSIEAISLDGRRSMPARVDRDLRVWPADVRPPAPENVTVAWVDDAGRKRIRLKWDPPKRHPHAIEGYVLYADLEGTGAAYVRRVDVPLFRGTEYTWDPPDVDRSYRLIVDSVSRYGMLGGVLNSTMLLKPGAVLPPVKVRPVQWYAGAKKVTLCWEYPPMPNLTGFRIYANGKMVADETKLGKQIREHTLDGLERGKCVLEVEAVPVEGPASERGAQVLTVR